jgi:hypothetical protein
MLQLVDGRLHELHPTPWRVWRLLGGERENEKCKGEDNEGGSLHEDPPVGVDPAVTAGLRKAR